MWYLKSLPYLISKDTKKVLWIICGHSTAAMLHYWQLNNICTPNSSRQFKINVTNHTLVYGQLILQSLSHLVNLSILRKAYQFPIHNVIMATESKHLTINETNE
jgi:hypothetical protein